jgi:hypothetical protein
MGAAGGFETVIFQNLTQIFNNLGNEILFIYNQLLVWMMTMSSTVAHNVFGHVQIYMQQMTSGASAATPRQLSVARSQWIRFCRATFQPTTSRIRDGIACRLRMRRKK